MRHNFLEKLRETSWKDVIHIFLFVIALPFAFFLKRKRPDMWLICEYENEARDNGYWLYKYIRENHKNQDVTYAINKQSEDYKKVAHLGRVVSYGTLRHWIYYLAARKNISSQKGGKPNAAVCYLLEVYGIRKNTRVFLQHGITKNDVSFLYYKNAKISLFVCAAKREFDFVVKKFGYPDGAVQQLGFCRFDNLYNSKVNQKQILVMPTWRSWISPPSNTKSRFDVLENMKQTEYYRKWNGFLQNKELLEWLHENGLHLVFYQHREMQKFTGLFQSPDASIKIANEEEFDVQSLLMESALLITDYSSVAMDFAYMKKPLAYFQFDQAMFRKNHYAEGYFSYEADGFGPVCKESQSLLEFLKRQGRVNFANETLYANRVETFFDLWDSKNCERNYLAIRNLK
ncbi:MAG: CDP-glycerol glycerophosphotransferase family protein [Lachnospiraceae bacterium]|nr:CDP-glycerol glycerophosphotransferase family protein [Lachnospiraceae bacterium]